MSGAGEMYALSIFPAHLPVQSFIQTIPELVVYICYTKYAH